MGHCHCRWGRMQWDSDTYLNSGWFKLEGPIIYAFYHNKCVLRGTNIGVYRGFGISWRPTSTAPASEWWDEDPRYRIIYIYIYTCDFWTTGSTPKKAGAKNLWPTCPLFWSYKDLSVSRVYYVQYTLSSIPPLSWVMTRKPPLMICPFTHFQFTPSPRSWVRPLQYHHIITCQTRGLLFIIRFPY